MVDAHWTDALVTARGSIRDAMRAIDEGAVMLAVAIDDDRRLVGIVSDGDIRRALLRGADLEDPVASIITTDPTVADPDERRADVLDLMQARSLSVIPIVDHDGRVVGLHTLSELVGVGQRPNVAVVMAGGRGTRLGSLTDEVPKPMLKVAGRPILERLVLHLVGAGIRRIVISVGYLADHIVSYFGDGAEFGCEIRYLREDPEQPLGSAGPLAFLSDEVGTLTHPVVVCNGDIVTDVPFGDLLDSHERSRAAATVAAEGYHHRVPFGVLHHDDGRLESIEEKPELTFPVSAGIYVLRPEVLGHVPLGPEVGMAEVLEGCLERGDHVHVWPLHGDWIDVGRPEELRRARTGR